MTEKDRLEPVPLIKALRKFRNSGGRFTVSARKILPDQSMLAYLKIMYMLLNLDQIESVFGFPEESTPLYGGRIYEKEHCLTDRQIAQLYDNDISLSLPLTNHFFDNASYQASLKMLKKYHRKGNAVICNNDRLATALKNDFPDYVLKASIIKKLDTPEKIENALTLYDSVVVPMDRNTDPAFLGGIRNKDRVYLFGNANCAFNCLARVCYRKFSRINRGEAHSEPVCSKSMVPRQDLGMVYFDVERFENMGFSLFKLVPVILGDGRIEKVVSLYSQKEI